MPVHSDNNARGEAEERGWFGALLAAALLLPAAAPAPLSFDTVFATAGEPRQLHFTLMYRNAEGVHRLAVWRQGQSQLKRVTDGAVTTLVRRTGIGPDFTMQVINPEKRTSTRIDRTSLYRVGQMTDWFDLAHGLRRPVGAYRVTTRAALPAMPRVPVPCRWYDLTAQGQTTSICWNGAARLPILIATGPGHPVWRVLSIDQSPIAPSTFRANDRGYIRDDATRDISND